MSYMSDFELHQTCLKFSSISDYQLSSDAWMDAGKVKKLAEIIPSMIAAGDRILIFSQFVIMLDILESVLSTLNLAYLRMDGSSVVSERQNLID